MRERSVFCSIRIWCVFLRKEDGNSVGREIPEERRKTHDVMVLRARDQSCTWKGGGGEMGGVLNKRVVSLYRRRSALDAVVVRRH